MAILEVQSTSAQFGDMLNIYQNLEVLKMELPRLGTFLAQRIEDPDILGQMQDAWNNFIESGQVWALLIGLFVGYMFRSMTTS